jgi:hypothetical protein
MMRPLNLTALVLAAAALLTGCPGIPCECDDPTVVIIPSDGSFVISDIRVEDWYDGGASDTWEWGGSGPWADIIEGEVVLEDGVLSVIYSTAEGSFQVELEEVETSGW